jgi:hypothetical protein
MKIRRVTSLLQAVTDVRRWLLERIPLTDTMVGYDLFLRIANDFSAGRPLRAADLLAGLPHPEALVAQQIRKMEDAYLLVEQDQGIALRERILFPTEKFIALLNDYRVKFESVFILRQGLRDEQLLVATANPEMRELAESLYDHLYDLGWLYLHNFGGVCFLMASLVKRVAEAYGHSARLASCYVEIARGDGRFMLGAPGYAKEGQIDGHAVCIIDEALLIDFGLGNVRRGYRRNFQWAVACDYQRQGPAMGTVTLPLPEGETMTWKDDWQSPASAAEFERYRPLVPELFKQYESYFM